MSDLLSQLYERAKDNGTLSPIEECIFRTLDEGFEEAAEAALRQYDSMKAESQIKRITDLENVNERMERLLIHFYVLKPFLDKQKSDNAAIDGVLKEWDKIRPAK